ncbi:diguanylate cyclase [Polynucleobacter sp. MWH-Mekk-B1]|uniref:GGDEF domain-containing protein n=1 Tax=Polynucleobacter finlandensis TaxID=1855894 RepID=UPI001C0E5E29|nr:GGDEF domain-containing protein [Polynucleobacter finlandensis]MBU3543474.1 diguanylate cyclase [Polynucleobacter finlandensis]
MDTHLAHPTFIPRRSMGRRVLDQALRSITQGVCVAGSDQVILSVNTAFTVITGYSETECVGRNCRFLQGPESDPKTIDQIREACIVGTSFSGEILNYRKDGTAFWNDLLISALKDTEDKPSFYIGIVRDVTEHRQLQEEMSSDQTVLHNILDTTLDGFWHANNEGRLLAVNDTYCRQSGYSQAELLSMRIADLEAQEDPIINRQHIEQIIREGRGQFESVHRRKDGTLWDVEISTTYHPDGEGQFLVFIRDITARKSAEKEVLQLAFYDPLTKVLNRRLFEDRLSQKLLQTQRNQQHGAILFIDLDHFKELNDTYGHQLGDVRLIDVAKRLKDGIREADTLARLGGDEFAIILGELGNDRANASLQAKKAAEKLCKSLSATACLKGVEHKTCQSDDSGKCRCSASIGVTLFSDNQLSPGQLLSQADAAMYQAKKAGGNRFQLYEANAQK